MALLEKINSPKDLKKLSPQELALLAGEIRDFLIEIVTKTGGHLGASLGTIELTLALHYLLNSPTDKILWDVSHQAYTHKIVTGRRDRFATLRQKGGISGFTDPKESEHDFFKVGHASTAISEALGLAVARDLRNGKGKIVAVVGDGALTGGLAYEALNNAGHTKRDLLIILNDNQMSISKNVGALSRYLNSIITNPLYNRIKNKVEQATSAMPRLQHLIRHAEETFKNLIVPGVLFEELGFRYFGPIDGHDVGGLVQNLKRVLDLKGPRIVHILTKKGRGYDLAESDPERMHGISATSKPETVKFENRAIEPVATKTYTEVFSDCLMELAEKDSRIVAITAAMPTGTGLQKFQDMFPDRFFDVGIAEQHAITFAGALAKGGRKPICAIYSSFLQRCVDQLIHDVALQGVNVVVAIDRAGVVGEDGPTHHGLFDLNFLRPIPGAVIANPKDTIEMRRMLELSFDYSGLFCLRYPRGFISREFRESTGKFEIGEGEILLEGDAVTILTFGAQVVTALEAARLLETKGVSASVINMRFVKPLDQSLLKYAVAKKGLIVTLEDHVLENGFGSAILEAFSDWGIMQPKVLRLGFRNAFMPHAKRSELLSEAGLEPMRLSERILKEIELCKK